MSTDRRADQERAIKRALALSLGLVAQPLLIDRVADADFQSSIDRLRGVPGTNKGGK